MESSVQIILIASILSLTIVFIIIGIWIVLILKELRQSFKKINSLLDDTESAVHSLVEPIVSLSEVWQGAKKGIGFLSGLLGGKPEEGDDEEEE